MRRDCTGTKSGAAFVEFSANDGAGATGKVTLRGTEIQGIVIY